MSSSVFSTESIPGFGIHTGFWINWSDGRFLGSTLTLDRRDGGLLISFIALFITFAGTAFWRISCFALHQHFASEAPRDGIYHQRQAILRNSANSTSGLCALGQAIWAWRKTSNRSCVRLLPLVAFASVNIAAFAVAGIFSSKIATSTGTEVLVSSPNCGRLRINNNMQFRDVNAVLLPYEVQRRKTFVTYSQQCYSNVSNSENCGLYVQSRLPTVVNRNASCPFPKEFCNSEWDNLELDTGLLDSNDHLGYNSPPEDRFQFRRLLKCAPMTKEGVSNTTTVEIPDANAMNYTMFYYGNRTEPSLIGMGDLDTNPFTYMYPEVSKERFLTESGLTAGADYSIAVARYINGTFNSNSSDFQPLPGLGHPDTELTLIFLSANGILFPQGTDDPWYSAHVDSGVDMGYHFLNSNATSLDGELRFYFADSSASTVGCTEQVQVCNPSAKDPQQRCTALRPTIEMFNGMAPHDFWSSERQRGIYSYFRRQFGDRTQMGDLIDILGVFSLTSRNSLKFGVQGPISGNQWQLDIENLHSATLASLQGNIFDFAAGPSDSSVMKWLYKHNDTSFKYVCENQKIRSSAHTSFNTFGLCVTLTVGAIVILVSSTLESIVGWVQRRRRLDTYARLEWCANETLQLQRLAHEELGLGGKWRRAAGAVPVAEGACKLAVLDLSDPEHPRLKAPPADLEMLTRAEDDRTTARIGVGHGGDGKQANDHILIFGSEQQKSSGDENRSISPSTDTQSPDQDRKELYIKEN